MSTYCVTFRIAQKTIGGKTYQERYDKLVENLLLDKAGNWREPTSFPLIESALDTNKFSARISSGLAKEDLLFVFDPEDMSACYTGVDRADVLESFFPKAKKL